MKKIFVTLILLILLFSAVASAARQSHSNSKSNSGDHYGDRHRDRHGDENQKATPTITWNNPADITFGTPLGGTQLNAVASVPGTWTYNPAAGTVLNAGTQTLHVDFAPTETANYNTASKDVTINVINVIQKTTPAITWNNPADITYGTPLSSTQLNAVVSVPGTYAYTPVAGTVLSAGTQTLHVVFTPTDNAYYNTATKDVTINVINVIQKTTPVITWNNPADITYGTPLSVTQLNAVASVPGTYVYTPVTGTVLNAGTQTLHVDFTPTDNANYNTATKDVTINVINVIQKTTPTITWNNPADITYGTAISGTQLNAVASVPGTFTYNPLAGTILNAGTQTLHVDFIPTDTANYNPTSKDVTINVTNIQKTTSTITWNNPADITYGTAISGTQLNAIASVSGTFTYNPPAGTVLNAGTQTLHVDFIPTDTANYNTASKDVTINIIVLQTSILADFNSNLTSGNAPLIVQFNDLSIGNPTAWEWDYNSDGLVDSTEKNPVYAFMYPGNYSVTLRASGNGTGWGNVTTKINYITIGGDFQAGFTAYPVQGDAPLQVQFNDTSTGVVNSWLWDFGDGNTSIEQNPTHTYYEPGSYPVTLNASNTDKYSVLTLPGYITVTDGGESSSSGGGSSSSTGTGSLTGTGGSPEPASNIAVKLQTQKYIAAGNHIIFEFTKNATYIDSVEFDAKRTLGKITTTVEQLKGRSVLAPTDPVGKVYKYLNIWIGNSGIAIPENIENATVKFVISKAEIEMNETEKSNIVLQRYEQGEWDTLNTIKTGEDEQYIYYQANTTSFSSFAITSGEMNPIEENVSQPIENVSQPKIPYNNELSIKGKQPMKSEAVNATDWSKYSGVIRYFVLFIVVLFLGLAIREKRK